MKSIMASLFCLAFSVSSVMTLSNKEIRKYNAASEDNYYVCFSNQNYKISNSNKMSIKDGEYVLTDVSLNSSVSFYITNANGKRWYGKNDEPMKVKEIGTYNYNIYFNVESIYDEENVSGNQYVSNSSLTYGFYMPDAYSLFVDDIEYKLTYNNYQTKYDAYYVNDLKLEEGQKLKVKDAYGNTYGYEGKDKDEYVVNASGYYNFVYTPGKTQGDELYYFDKDGNYGTGEDFAYDFKITDTEFYYVVFENELLIDDENITVVNDTNAYRLYKDEKYPNEDKYTSSSFFVPTKDQTINYKIYLYTSITDTYVQVDNDKNEYSFLTASDPSWYTLSFVDLGEKNKSFLETVDEDYDGYYLVGDCNNFNFTQDGEVNLNDEYKFKLIEENDGDDLYTEDYDQYILNLSVTNSDLKNGSFDFYISNGKDKYKNGVEYISLKQPGDYQIIFSDEHLYGRGRNYKYSLIEKENATEYIEISTVEEFKDMIEKCNDNAEYSYNKEFIVTDDLDFSNIVLPSIKVFNGKLNGSYHNISNVSFATEETLDCVGLINVLTKEGSVSNLRVDNLNIDAPDATYVGLICKSYGSITGVTVTGTVSGNSYVGGICGYSSNYVLDEGDVTDSTKHLGYGQIDRCTNFATVKGLNNVGGIVGFNGGKITSSTNKGLINNVNYDSKKLIMNVGGIAGYSTGYIVDSTNSNSVGYKNIGSFVGGIAGLSNGSFYYCTNNGKVTGKSSVGGIIGYYGTLNKDGKYDSYFQGVNYEDIIKDYFHDDATADFDEQEDLGNHLVTYCVNNASVVSSTYAGGIIGSASSENSLIKNVMSDASIYCYSGSYCGGIAGELVCGTIQSAVSTGYLYADGTSNGNYVGGIAGSCSGTINYCASSVTIKGKNYLGGIVGYGSSTCVVKSNYANVLVLGISNSKCLGSIAGQIDGINESNSKYNNVKYNYYVSKTLGGLDGVNFGNNSDDAAKRLDMDQLECKEELTSFVNINFSGDYFIGGEGDHSYPYLRYFELCDEEEKFDFALSYTTLFDKYTQSYKDIENKALRTSIVISFLEWNKNSGEVDNYDNYDVVDVQRVFFGDEYPEYPAFIYAREENGIFKFKGDECDNFVSWNPIDEESFEDQMIYARYDEIITSISSEDNHILVEGEFVKGTRIEVTQTGSYYQIHFFVGDKEIDYKNYTVKYRIEKGIEHYEVVLIDSKNETVLPSTIYGDCIVFDLENPGQTFYLRDTSVPVPMWAWLVMTGGLVFIVTLLVMLAIMRSKVKKANVTGFLRGRKAASNKVAETPSESEKKEETLSEVTEEATPTEEVKEEPTSEVKEEVAPEVTKEAKQEEKVEEVKTKKTTKKSSSPKKKTTTKKATKKEAE